MNLIEYYQKPGPMSQLGSMQDMVSPIETSIERIVEAVQNCLLHQHWSKAYGITLTQQQIEEPYIRDVESKLNWLRAKGYKSVYDPHPTKDHMIGICRDFSLLAVALCQAADIPARARCGFATYLETKKYIDHWVLEYWNQQQQRWIIVDAQLDQLQQDDLKIDFDPLDVPTDRFIIAPTAWLNCRQGFEDPSLFGIFKWWGYDYLRCNLLLDANALCQKTMQPWDYWPGYKSLPIDAWQAHDFEILDELARKTLSIDHTPDAFFDYIKNNDKIGVPEDISIVYNGFLQE